MEILWEKQNTNILKNILYINKIVLENYTELKPQIM